MKQGLFWLLGVTACVFNTLAYAQEQAPAPSQPSLTASQIIESPTFLANRQEILARARSRVEQSSFIVPEVKETILKELDDLPYTRIIDLELAFFTGMPDLFALCVEGHPKGGLAIEGCASAAVFISSLSASVHYRWDLVRHTSPSGRFQQLSLGPGVGFRGVEQSHLCIWGPCRPPSHGKFIDYTASLEYVSWMHRKWGLTMQLDLGANQFLGSRDGGQASMIPRPEGKFTIGITWVKPRRR